MLDFLINVDFSPRDSGCDRYTGSLVGGSGERYTATLEGLHIGERIGHVGSDRTYAPIVCIAVLEVWQVHG